MIPRAILAVAYATGRASHARQVKGDDPDKKGYPGPPGWGFGIGLTTPHSKKLIVTKVEQSKSWMDLTMMERVGDRWEKNGRILFDRPKPTAGCSASGRRISGIYWISLYLSQSFKICRVLPVNFQFKIVILPPLQLCCQGWLHQSLPPTTNAPGVLLEINLS
jgi:hypothetical protein